MRVGRFCSSQERQRRATNLWHVQASIRRGNTSHHGTDSLSSSLPLPVDGNMKTRVQQVLMSTEQDGTHHGTYALSSPETRSGHSPRKLREAM
jgi:hypothetical protein